MMFTHDIIAHYRLQKPTGRSFNLSKKLSSRDLLLFSSLLIQLKDFEWRRIREAGGWPKGGWESLRLIET